MKKRDTLYIFPVLTAILLNLSSCALDSCFDETEALLEASFYSYSAKTAITPDSLTVFGLGMDTRIYSASKAIRIARLPLNPVADSTSFIIRINGISDTLSFRHTNYPHLISRECGYIYFHDIDSMVFFTVNTIDSIWVRNRTITNLDEENIRIFY